MSKFTLCATTLQLLQIRQESLLRKKALATYGPQGTLDLALLGAILGNHVREIGRFKVTCDGELVQGQYSIYELVNFGVLSVTGRKVCRSSPSSPSCSRRGSDCSFLSSPRSSATTTTNSTASARIYPATLANLFPALVFKALRRKGIRAPKFQPDDEDEKMSSTSSLSQLFPCEESFPPNLEGESEDMSSTDLGLEDTMLITSEKVLASLVQQRLHRVKDLPLPSELCFLGAVSLPLPPVLRTMHVAWTMSFLQVRARTPRRQRKQQQNHDQGGSIGGLDFRPDLYAHKMRLARLVRAQQGKGKAGAGASTARVLPQSAAINRGSSSTSIPEENEDIPDEQGSRQEQDNVVKAKTLTMGLAKNIPPPIAIPMSTTSALSRNERTRTATTVGDPAVPRQDKRLMQQLLSLENKVPRIVRQWEIAARACFAEELQQEDRLVQEWVDRQRLQVVLGFGGLMSSSPSTKSIAAGGKMRPRLSPITTNVFPTRHINHSGNAYHSKSSSSASQRIRHRLSSSLPTAAAVLAASSSSVHGPLHSTEDSNVPVCFPEGISRGASQGLEYNDPFNKSRESTSLASRPTSAFFHDHQRLSCSQQMLSMHLWLSLLVSPLSPQQMQDHLGLWPSAETANNNA